MLEISMNEHVFVELTHVGVQRIKDGTAEELKLLNLKETDIVEGRFIKVLLHNFFAGIPGYPGIPKEFYTIIFIPEE